MAYIPIIAELILCEEGQKLYDEYDFYLHASEEEFLGKKMLDAHSKYLEHRLDCQKCTYKRPDFLKTENETFSDKKE